MQLARISAYMKKPHQAYPRPPHQQLKIGKECPESVLHLIYTNVLSSHALLYSPSAFQFQIVQLLSAIIRLSPRLLCYVLNSFGPYFL